MGNRSVKEGKVIVDNKTYTEKLLAYHKLEVLCTQQKSAIQSMIQEKEELKMKVEKLLKFNLIKEKEIQSLESDILKYKSFPIMDSILNARTQINELDDDINKFLETKQKEDGSEIFEEINQTRKDVNGIKHNLQNNVLPEANIVKLRHLERDFKNEQKDYKGRLLKKQLELQELLDKVKELKEKLPELITRQLFKVDNKICDIRSALNDIQNNPENLTCLRLKERYMEELNILLKLKLNTPAQPRNLIFCNVPEEYGSDYEKIKDILSTFNTISDNNMMVTRMGRSVLDKPRLIKVSFSNPDDVQAILRYKYKLKNGPHSAVRIYPDKYE